MSDILLIKNWHEKAKEDYFSRYIFEYLAFEAFLKNYKYSKEEIQQASKNTNERAYIQYFKADDCYVSKWESLLRRNAKLKDTLQELIDFLKNEPILSRSDWWNCKSFDSRECVKNAPQGTILKEEDFINLIEFWYIVRNNLFHASKNSSNIRDEKLVTYAYKTLSCFFENVLLPELDKN